MVYYNGVNKMRKNHIVIDYKDGTIPAIKRWFRNLFNADVNAVKNAVHDTMSASPGNVDSAIMAFYKVSPQMTKKSHANALKNARFSSSLASGKFSIKMYYRGGDLDYSWFVKPVINKYHVRSKHYAPPIQRYVHTLMDVPVFEVSEIMPEQIPNYRGKKPFIQKINKRQKAHQVYVSGITKRQEYNDNGSLVYVSNVKVLKSDKSIPKMINDKIVREIYTYKNELVLIESLKRRIKDIEIRQYGGK